MTQWQVIVISLLAAASCGKDKSSSTSDGDVASQVITVSGSLAINAEEVSDENLKSNVKVELQDNSGHVVSSAFTKSDGSYDIPLSGALVVNSEAAALAGGNFVLRGGFTDSQSGKAYGLNETLSITADALETHDKGGKAFKVGSKTVSEIGGITATITFEDSSTSPDGAEVYIPGKSFFAKLGEDGKVELFYVPAGDYTLKIEKGFYSKSVSVSVQENKTTALGTVTVSAYDVRPAPLSELLLGTWSSQCYESSSKTTATITVNSLTSISFANANHSSLFSSGSCAQTNNAVKSIEVLSPRALRVTYDNVGADAYAHLFVIDATKTKITFVSGSKYEIWTKQE